MVVQGKKSESSDELRREPRVEALTGTAKRCIWRKGEFECPSDGVYGQRAVRQREEIFTGEIEEAGKRMSLSRGAVTTP